MGLRIMVVDDSTVALESARQALEDAGFEVNTLENPLSLAHVILRKKPDLVLLDINMPAVNGVTVAKIIRQCLPNSSVPILLHSDLPAEELDRHVSECGAAGYIRKTGAAEELVQGIRTFLAARPPPARA